MVLTFSLHAYIYRIKRNRELNIFRSPVVAEDISNNSISIYAEPFECRSLVKTETTGHVQVIGDIDRQYCTEAEMLTNISATM